MFSNGRYVIVDDNPDQLRPLVEAMHGLNAPCLGIHYKADTGIADGRLRGVRLLFIDLHLQGAPVGGATVNYAVIADILERSIVPQSGPYVLILWTAHAEELEAFRKYIAENVPPAHRPLAILGLDKNLYLAAGAANHARLRADIETAVAADVRLRALLSWENDVLAAAGATLAEIGSLIPEADRTIERYPASLDGILSILALAAAGQNAGHDPRAAVNAALAPLLSDRIVNQSAAAEINALWGEAVTRIGNPPKLSPQDAARMNTMVHLALPEAGAVRASDWGAVVRLPDNEISDDGLKNRWGYDRAGLLDQLFRVAPEHGANSIFCIVRMGAVCDFAQGKDGPINYALGLIHPTDAKRIKSRKAPDSEMTTVAFKVSLAEHPVEIVLNARMQASLTAVNVEGWEVLFRIREQLLSSIIMHYSGYTTRPGILSFKS